MKVRDVMTRDPQVCLPETPLDFVARMMLDRDCGAIPVVGDLDGLMPMGIITDRDIVTRAVARGLDPCDLTVRDAMTMPVVTVLEDTRLGDLVEILELGQIRRVVVVNERGAVIGIVAQADIARNASKRETGELVRGVSEPSAAVFSH